MIMTMIIIMNKKMTMMTAMMLVMVLRTMKRVTLKKILRAMIVWTVSPYCSKQKCRCSLYSLLLLLFATFAASVSSLKYSVSASRLCGV